MDTARILDSIYLALPELGMLAAGCLFFLLGTVFGNRHFWAVATVIVLGLALLFQGIESGNPETNGNWLLHGGATFFRFLGPVIGLIGAILIAPAKGSSGKPGTEEFGCLLIASAGVGLAGMAPDLILLFLGLELVSIPVYLLLFSARHDRPGLEAAIKYFLLSVLSSAFFLFGASYLYGITGSTRLEGLGGIHENLRWPEANPGVIPAARTLALLFLLAGVGFKITATPFHFYAPDVYQGTSPAAAGLLATLPKAAGFAALLRLIAAGEGGLSPFGGVEWSLLWILAVATMTLGNLLALWQKNIHRLLAYSGIAQGGYMLAAVSTGSLEGLGAMAFYLAAYSLMTLGIFAVLAYLDDPSCPVKRLDDLAGLVRTRPVAAISLGVCVIGLIGLPLTSGFIGKLQILRASLAASGQQGNSLYLVLAFFIVINAVISAWYYLAILSRAFLRLPLGPQPQPGSPLPLLAAVACAVVTVVGGIAPGLADSYVQPVEKETARADIARPDALVLNRGMENSHGNR